MKLPKFIALDFEFGNTREKYYTVLCAAAREDGEGTRTTKSWWFREISQVENFLSYVYENRTAVWLTYSATAEIRSLMSLLARCRKESVNWAWWPISPREMNWVDLLVEWRLLRNGNQEWQRLYHTKNPEGHPTCPVYTLTQIYDLILYTRCANHPHPQHNSP